MHLLLVLYCDLRRDIRAECAGLSGGAAALRLLEPAFLDKPRFCGHGPPHQGPHQHQGPPGGTPGVPARMGGCLGPDLVPKLDLSRLAPVAGMPSGGLRRAPPPTSHSTISLAWG